MCTARNTSLRARMQRNASQACACNATQACARNAMQRKPAIIHIYDIRKIYYKNLFFKNFFLRFKSSVLVHLFFNIYNLIIEKMASWRNEQM